jgi:DNA-directed RNA polymerase beta' subunit
MSEPLDFSARVVIMVDLNLGITQAGVPWSVARNLTVPVRNIHELFRRDDGT